MKEFEFRMSYTASEIAEHVDGMSHIEMMDDSMMPRIRKGDWVVYDKYLKEIYPEPTPLVVKLNGATLVREARQDQNGVITLRSCSRKVETITVSVDDDFVVVGRVCGMIRRTGKNKDARSRTLISYPQPKNSINDDPMGLGKSGPDAYDTLPPTGPSMDDGPISEEARYLMNINPALYTVVKYISEAPKGAMERFEMPDESMMGFIAPGDVLLCDTRLKEPDPKRALLFGVRIGDQRTVREVWHDRRGNIRIRPHNGRFPAYIVEEDDDFEMIGKLIAVTELSLRHNDQGQEINNMKFKLLPAPRWISVSEG